MKKKTTIISLVVLAFILLAVASYYGYLYYTEKKINQKSAQENTQTSADETSTEFDPQNSSANIHVFSPKRGETVGLPLKILGEARVFEAVYQVRIKDKKGNILNEESGMTLAGDVGEFNLFQKDMNYEEPQTTDGTVEIFQYSAKDGSEIDKVTIPVKFNKVNSTKVKLFFGDETTGQTDCSKLAYVYRRVAYSKDLPKTAIEELLKGIKASEGEKGFFTSINTGVKLNKIEIKNGEATVDFDQALEAGVGGSCKVTTIRAQITQTLKQFSQISKVTISINGRTEDILQP